MKTLFRILILGILLVLGYNYFFGDTAEKQQSQEIITDVVNLGKSVKDFILSEKGKYDEGKYDDMVDKVQDVFSFLQDNIGKLSKADRDTVEKKSEEIKKELEEIKRDTENNRVEQANDRIDQLMKKLEELEKSFKEEMSE